VFGNQALLHLAPVVLIPDHTSMQLLDQVADGIFRLSGAAIFCALKEYELGKMKPIDFSDHLMSSVHACIIGVIEEAVVNNCTHFKFLRTTLQNVVRANCTIV